MKMTELLPLKVHPFTLTVLQMELFVLQCSNASITVLLIRARGYRYQKDSV